MHFVAFIMVVDEISAKLGVVLVLKNVIGHLLIIKYTFCKWNTLTAEWVRVSSKNIYKYQELFKTIRLRVKLIIYFTSSTTTTLVHNSCRSVFNYSRPLIVGKVCWPPSSTLRKWMLKSDPKTWIIWSSSKQPRKRSRLPMLV